MEVSEKQIDAVFALSAPKRYEHFIKVAVDWEEVWALNDDGWVLSEEESGSKVFPIWPAKKYAEHCATDDWAGAVAKSIALQEFIEDVIPYLAETNTLPGIFFTPDNGSVDVSSNQLIEDLCAEMKKYT